MVCDDLAARSEEIGQVRFRFGDEECPDAGRFVKAHVVREPLRNVSVPVEHDPCSVIDAVHVEPPRLAAIARPDRRVVRESADSVAPELDRCPIGNARKNIACFPPLGTGQRSDECGIQSAAVFVSEAVENTWVEPDAEELGIDTKLTQSWHELWERRDEQVEALESFWPRRRSSELAYEETRAKSNRGEHLGRKVTDVLNVDDVRLEILHLSEQHLITPTSVAVAAERGRGFLCSRAQASWSWSQFTITSWARWPRSPRKCEYASEVPKERSMRACHCTA